MHQLPTGTNPLSLTCAGSCGTYRIYRGPLIGRIPNSFVFCPVCGGPAAAHQNQDENQFEVWAQSLDTEPEIVRAAWDLWDYHTYPIFFDFVRTILDDPESLTA